MSPRQRFLVERQLQRRCEKLYDARTPERTRRRLSMEVSMLRCRLAGVSDPLAAMCAASEQEDEC